MDISVNINISCHVGLFDWHNKNEHSRNRKIQGVCQRTPTVVLMAQHKSPKNVTDLCNDVVTKRFGQRRRTPRGHKKLSDLGEKSHSKTEEPAMSTKELLLEKTGMGKSSSGRGGT